MNHLPSTVSDLLSADNDVLNAVFKIEESGAAMFVLINQKFIDFHKRLGITVLRKDLLNTTLDDYFRLYLGFTEDQVELRLSSLKLAIKKGTPYPFKEVSDHPGVPVLVLDSVWRPVKANDQIYVVWESRVYHQSKL